MLNFGSLSKKEEQSQPSFEEKLSSFKQLVCVFGIKSSFWQKMNSTLMIHLIFNHFDI